MSLILRVKRLVPIDEMILSAVRLIGQRDLARKRKDWAEADSLRDLAFEILDGLGCTHVLKDHGNEGSSLAVAVPTRIVEVIDEDLPHLWPGDGELIHPPRWLPHHGNQKVEAWRCSRCGRVTNIQPMINDTNGPSRCPWCDGLVDETYETLDDLYYSTAASRRLAPPPSESGG